LQAQKKPRAGRADAGQRRAWAGGQISAPSQRNTLGAALFPSSGFFLKIFLGLRIRSRPSPIFGSHSVSCCWSAGIGYLSLFRHGRVGFDRDRHFLAVEI
jgi:hypothetical protein